MNTNTNTSTPKFSSNEYSHYSGPFSAKAKFTSPEEEHEWAENQTKSCNKCDLVLPYTSFGTNTSGTDPFDRYGNRLRRGECEDCNKKIAKGKKSAKNLAKKLGLDKAPEGTCCKLCGSTQKIVFDHHHEKDIFRGWICDGCNRSIGMLGESLHSLIRVVNYLNETEQKQLRVNPETGLLEIVE